MAALARSDWPPSLFTRSKMIGSGLRASTRHGTSGEGTRRPSGGDISLHATGAPRAEFQPGADSRDTRLDEDDDGPAGQPPPQLVQHLRRGDIRLSRFVGYRPQRLTHSVVEQVHAGLPVFPRCHLQQVKPADDFSKAAEDGWLTGLENQPDPEPALPRSPQRTTNRVPELQYPSPRRADDVIQLIGGLGDGDVLTSH